MPRLYMGDEWKTANRLLAKDIGSPLPASPEVAEATMPVERGAMPYLYAQRSNELWQQGTQIGLAGLVKNVGVRSIPSYDGILKGITLEEYELVSWDSFFDPSDDLPTGSLLDIAKTVAVKAIAEAIANIGLEVAGNLSKAIPVIGWIVGSMIDMGLGVAEAVRQQRRADMPKTVRPAIFRPERDIAIYEAVCKPALESGDWTNLWLPPGFMGNLIGTLGPFGRNLEEDWTVAISAREPNFWHEEAGGTGAVAGGMIPGTINLHQGIDVMPGGRIRDWGSLLPTLRKQCMWMWQGYTASQSEQAMFSVRADVIAQDWAGYLMFLRRMLDGDFGGFGQSVEFPSRGECKDALGANRCSGRKGYPFTDADRIRIIEFYADKAWFGWSKGKGTDDNPYGIYTSTPVKQAKKLRNRQFKALDTLLVAYLTEDMAAFSDPELKAKWQKRRGDLLKHPAVCLVDLDAVPTYEDGGIWLEQLQRAGAGSPRCGPHRLTAAGKGKEGDFTEPDTPALPLGLTAGATGAGVGGVLLVAAAVAAFLATRGR